MRRALRLAEKAKGWTLPNPLVGAVIIKDGERIGEGYHRAYGEAHAEVEAINSATSNLDTATLYVTLEPCCHTGKTKPCTEAIIKSGIKKVIIASKDPSKKVSGKGIDALINAGIEVEVGLLEDAAKKINPEFFTLHTKNRPYITLKIAMSLDANVAEKHGMKTPLTSKKALKKVHVMRHEHQAILIGSGTALTDNPHLGVRLITGRDPIRVIMKGKRKLPKDLKIFRDDNIEILENKTISEALKILADKNISSILVEGGPSIITAFLENKSADEIQCFIAPKILGKNGLRFQSLNSVVFLKTKSVQQLGPDIMITYTPEWYSNNS